MPRELSIFADESDGRRGKSKYYLLSFVFHDRGNDILESVGMHENALRRADLPNIPFHSEPLLNGRGAYDNLDIATLTHSRSCCTALPPWCGTFRLATARSPTGAANTRTLPRAE